MDRRHFLLSGPLAALLANPFEVLGSQRAQIPGGLGAIVDYQFRFKDGLKIGMEPVQTTPEEFLRAHPNVVAAINGPIYNPDAGKTQGIAYLTKGRHFGDNDLKHVHGYFTINLPGTRIEASEKFNGNYDENWMVVGHYPLLLARGQIDNRVAAFNRYGPAYRSAIGTSDGTDIHLVVSLDRFTMEQWAQRLRSSGLYGAMNLDGGNVSQLALRKEDKSIEKYGRGNEITKLMIFVFRP